MKEVGSIGRLIDSVALFRERDRQRNTDTDTDHAWSTVQRRARPMRLHLRGFLILTNQVNQCQNASEMNVCLLDDISNVDPFGSVGVPSQLFISKDIARRRKVLMTIRKPTCLQLQLLEVRPGAYQYLQRSVSSIHVF